MNKKKLLSGLAITIMFIFLAFSWRFLYEIKGYSDLGSWTKYSIRYILQIGLCMLFTWLFVWISKTGVHTFMALGLRSNVFKGIGLSFIFTFPMLAGYFAIAPLNSEITFLDILFWAFISPFAEELIFRGFFFGILFRYLKVGFVPAILLTSIVFGLGHWSQGEDLSSSLGILGITFAGGLVFGWIYIEWENNLWVPIFTHVFMNLYWSMFDIGASNALGGWGANVFRVLSIIVIVSLTLIKIRRGGSNLNKRWVNI